METIELRKEDDIVWARQAARSLAEKLGFSILNKTRIATAVSELARNVVMHGGGGCMEMEEVVKGVKKGVRCIFIDEGPGIPEIEQAMNDGFTTTDGLGQGLPGCKRLTDEMKIHTKAGNGTRIEVIKWR